MTRPFPTIGLILAISLSFCAEAVAAETNPGAIQGCFVRDYPQGATTGGYSRIVVSIGAIGSKSSSSDDPAARLQGRDVQVYYKLWSLPHADVGYDKWQCSDRGHSILCPQECGLSDMTLRPLLNGDLLVEAGFEIDQARVQSLILDRSNGLFVFNGTHVLRRAPPEQCVRPTSPGDENRIVFQPGDYHLAIAEIGAQLAKLGFLLASTGELYSNEIAEAMRAFQASVGAPVTGLADARSLRLLGLSATLSGSC
jgi:hypothetical protein